MFWFFLCCMKIVKFLAFSKHWTVPSIFSTPQCSVQIWSFSQLSILALLAFFAKGIPIQPVFVLVYVIVFVFALICELVQFWRHISYARWASVTHTIYRAYFTHKHRIFHSQKQNTSLSNTEYFTHRMFVYTRLMKQSNTHFANTKHETCKQRTQAPRLQKQNFEDPLKHRNWSLQITLFFWDQF